LSSNTTSFEFLIFSFELFCARRIGAEFSIAAKERKEHKKLCVSSAGGAKDNSPRWNRGFDRK
jgi:hypothetical protein